MLGCSSSILYKPTTTDGSSFISINPLLPRRRRSQAFRSAMGTLPRCLLAVVLLAAVVAHGAEPAETAASTSMVVGLAKCADCSRKNMKAEAVFNGLQVAVKCKNAAGVLVTKALGGVDKSGAFSVPLAADLLREDGELKQDCFAQLHSAATKQPCPGQEPSWIVRPTSAGNTFVAVAGEVHYPSKECASAFLCHHFFKKHLKKPTVMIPHIHKKKPAVPEYKKPPPTTPAAVPVYHSPVPEYKPPHPTATPIYSHPTADQLKTQNNPETDPEKFKKLLPFIKKKKPFFFPKFPKFPPGKEEEIKA